jgi:hypothetical protein
MDSSPNTLGYLSLKTVLEDTLASKYFRMMESMILTLIPIKTLTKET